MNCQEIDRYIFEYFNHELSEEKRGLIEEHIKHCTICAKQHQITLQENAYLRGIPENINPSKNFTNNVMVKIHEKAGLHKKRLTSKKIRNKKHHRNTSLLVGVMLVFLLIPGIIYAAKFEIIPLWDNNQLLKQQASQEEQRMPAATSILNDIATPEKKIPVMDEPTQEIEATRVIDDFIPGILPSEEPPPPVSMAMSENNNNESISQLSVPYSTPSPQAPEHYRLVETIANQAEEKTVHVFEEIDTDTEFTLSIQAKQDKKTTPRVADSSEKNPETGTGEIGIMSVPLETSASIYHWDIVFQEKEYTVSIEAPLPIDTLSEIAQSIDFPDK